MDGQDCSSSLEGIAGLDRPKLIEWEDLQQELARFCSLSSELDKATYRKQQLSRRLQSVIQVRTDSLCQANELEEMKQKLQAKKAVMSALSIRTKRLSEESKKKSEELSFATRLLLVSGKTLSAAYEHLQEANRLLAGKRGYGCLSNMQKMLRMRQQYMVSQVASLYPLKTSIKQSRRDSCSPGESAASPSQKSLLTILGLQLTVIPMKKLSFFGNKEEVQKSASVLGYVAHAVLLIVSYIGVPLRYPLRLGGSRSYVLDYAPSTESTSSESASSSMGVDAEATEFPLFLEGQDTTRAAYAIFLLNKDLEQLLNFLGAESLGPRQVLANLKEVMRIIQSCDYIES